MVDRYEKNRERMQLKQAEHAAEERAAEEQTEQSEPAQEKTEPTDTDVLEKALKGKEKNKRPLWQRFLIRAAIVIVKVIAVACFLKFADYVLATYR